MRADLRRTHGAEEGPCREEVGDEGGGGVGDSREPAIMPR